MPPITQPYCRCCKEAPYKDNFHSPQSVLLNNNFVFITRTAKSLPPNFSSEVSEVSELECFKWSPVSTWDFKSFFEYVTEDKRNKPKENVIFAKRFVRGQKTNGTGGKHRNNNHLERVTTITIMAPWVSKGGYERLEGIKFATPEPEPTSFLSESTDESFELKEKPSEYGEIFKQRRYILE
ncbi:hypothetical protein BDF21DRAFT_403416 [Thamnidium elegans]|nr:hypothetical protein BDF21DRAFT_403416 [Thamnidium elegans]